MHDVCTKHTADKCAAHNQVVGKFVPTNESDDKVVESAQEDDDDNSTYIYTYVFVCVCVCVCVCV